MKSVKHWHVRVLALMAVMAIFGGCLVQPASTDANSVAAYNTQIVGLLGPFVAPIVSLLGVLALWLKSNWDKRELAKKTDDTAAELHEASRERNEKVIDEVRQQKELNVTALNAANNLNEKMLAVQKQVEENTKRAPSRATDTVVQKVELATGAGVDTPLKIEEQK